ncbi:MAG: PcfJ domain-containing protein [Myxococcota bacterium]
MTTLPPRRQRGLGVRAMLNRHRPLRNLPHPAAARTLALLYALDRGGHRGPCAQTVALIRDLAQVPWLRPLQPGLVTPDLDLQPLVQHLLVRVRYPLPAWLWARVLPPWTPPCPPSVLPELRVLAHLGAGGDLRMAPGLPKLTRREAHALFLDGRGVSLWAAARRAQLHLAGASEALTDAIVASPLAHITDVALWAAVVRWLVRIDLPADLVADVAAWLEGQGWTVPDQWSRDRVDGAIDAWILERFASGELAEDLPLPRLPLAREPVLDGWSVRQLTTYRALCEEGRAMDHCVAEYVADAMRHRSTLWTFRQNDERRLTLELEGTRVVTALGLCNRDPHDEEWEALTRLAGRLGWTLDV